MKGPVRVLLVEDDPKHRETVRSYLAESGCDVIEAESVGSALSAIDAGADPELVISEYRLKDAPGDALFLELSDRPNVPELLLMSTFGDAPISGRWNTTEKGRLLRHLPCQLQLIRILRLVRGS